MEAGDKDLGGTEEGNGREWPPLIKRAVEEAAVGGWPTRGALPSEKHDSAHTPPSCSHASLEMMHVDHPTGRHGNPRERVSH